MSYLYDGHKVKPLCITLPKMSGYGKCYVGQTKYMYFLIEDDDLLEKYNIVWDKVSADVKKELDREHVHNKIFLKSYGDEVTDFYDKRQVFLKECK